ncbi:MAG: transcription antitermination factor NusB [Actinomycetaceae bacterium]|nr:transcription antitermination factor NusB [Actinomycetaceae bacterium]
MRPRRFTSRTRARKRAVDTIFEADQRGQGMSAEGLSAMLEARKELTAAQTPLPAYSISIVEGVIGHLSQIDDLIASHCTTRPYDRLPAVDRAIMRVGTWEMLWNHDVPEITAIDEAVRIAKEISTDESPAIVNAILDAVRENSEGAIAAEAALAAAFEPRDDDFASDESDDELDQLDDYDDEPDNRFNHVEDDTSTG